MAGYLWVNRAERVNQKRSLQGFFLEDLGYSGISLSNILGEKANRDMRILQIWKCWSRLYCLLFNGCRGCLKY